MTILITGFEPFDGSPINPSEQVCAALSAEQFDGLTIRTVTLPVDGRRGPSALLAAFRKYQPQAVICLGEASGITQVALERIAVNLQDYRIPDNDGHLISDQPVISAGPSAYFSTLPLRPILNAIREAGIPADLSLSAGAYLCNQVFYTLMHHLAMNAITIPAGFIHLPSLPSQVALKNRPGPSMSLETSLEAVRIAVQVVTSSQLLSQGGKTPEF